MASKKKNVVNESGEKVNRSKAIREALNDPANAGKGNKEIAALVSASLKTDITPLTVGAVKSQLNKKSRTEEAKPLSGVELSAFNKAAVKEFGGLDGVKKSLATTKSVLALPNIGSVERAEEAITMLEGLLAEVKA